jgi:hypothetical protein
LSISPAKRLFPRPKGLFPGEIEYFLAQKTFSRDQKTFSSREMSISAAKRSFLVWKKPFPDPGAAIRLESEQSSRDFQEGSRRSLSSRAANLPGQLHSGGLQDGGVVEDSLGIYLP